MISHLCQQFSILICIQLQLYGILYVYKLFEVRKNSMIMDNMFLTKIKIMKKRRMNKIQKLHRKKSLCGFDVTKERKAGGIKCLVRE